MTRLKTFLIALDASAGTALLVFAVVNAATGGSRLLTAIAALLAGSAAASALLMAQPLRGVRASALARASYLRHAVVIGAMFGGGFYVGGVGLGLFVAVIGGAAWFLGHRSKRPRRAGDP